MRVIRPGERLAADDLKRMASGRFGDMVKAVVDVERGIMAVDAELHADQEALLIGEGSQLSDLWGINLYPDLDGEDFVEFDEGLGDILELEVAENDGGAHKQAMDRAQAIVQLADLVEPGNDADPNGGAQVVHGTFKYRCRPGRGRGYRSIPHHPLHRPLGPPRGVYPGSTLWWTPS